MKPANFPARKLMRQQDANFRNGVNLGPDHEKKLVEARNIRTKKRRAQ